jgi:hypothetical protein
MAVRLDHGAWYVKCNIAKSQERLRARGVEAKEPASLSITLPIIVAAANESRDDLQDLWARLLAASVDPTRAKSFRIAFIDVAKRMDPLDAAALRSAQEQAAGAVIDIEIRRRISGHLKSSLDEIDVSFRNLAKLELVQPVTMNQVEVNLTSFGREFLRAVSD